MSPAPPGVTALEGRQPPLLLGGGVLLLGWAVNAGGGLGRILNESSRLQTTQVPFWTLVPAAVTANVGYWATLSLNIPHYTRVAEYVKQLPPGAVFATLLHSGSIHYYTGRDILRWDLVDAASFDNAVEYLRVRGHDVYLIADDADFGQFKMRMANTRALRDLHVLLSVDLGGVRTS